MMSLKRKEVEETVKENKADELSAMFNMLCDEKRKNKGTAFFWFIFWIAHIILIYVLNFLKYCIVQDEGQQSMFYYFVPIHLTISHMFVNMLARLSDFMCIYAASHTVLRPETKFD